MRYALCVLAALALTGCGESTKDGDDGLIAFEVHREAVAALNHATTQLGVAAITNADTAKATDAYLRAVNTAVGVLPARYIVGDPLVGIVANERRIAAWCEPCAARLARRADALRKSPRKFPGPAASQ